MSVLQDYLRTKKTVEALATAKTDEELAQELAKIREANIELDIEDIQPIVLKALEEENFEKANFFLHNCDLRYMLYDPYDFGHVYNTLPDSQKASEWLIKNLPLSKGVCLDIPWLESVRGRSTLIIDTVKRYCETETETISLCHLMESAARAGDLEAINWIQERWNADKWCSEMVFHEAVMSGNIAVVEHLLNATGTKPAAFRSTLISAAVIKGKPQVLNWIRENIRLKEEDFHSMIFTNEESLEWVMTNYPPGKRNLYLRGHQTLATIKLFADRFLTKAEMEEGIIRIKSMDIDGIAWLIERFQVSPFQIRSLMVRADTRKAKASDVEKIADWELASGSCRLDLTDLSSLAYNFEALQIYVNKFGITGPVLRDALLVTLRDHKIEEASWVLQRAKAIEPFSVHTTQNDLEKLTWALENNVINLNPAELEEAITYECENEGNIWLVKWLVEQLGRAPADMKELFEKVCLENKIGIAQWIHSQAPQKPSRKLLKKVDTDVRMKAWLREIYEV